MRRNAWVALGLAFAMLVAIPAEAGTRTTSTKKKRANPGYTVFREGEDQIKLFWCLPGQQRGEPPGQAPDEWTLPDQTANQPLDFGIGWGVLEESQSWRSREIQAGTLWLEHQLVGGAWEQLYMLEWANGEWVESGGLPPAVEGTNWAWTDPYWTTNIDGRVVWRVDWDLVLPDGLPAGNYALSHMYFELQLGSNAEMGGDPPGPYLFDYPDCFFEVVTPPPGP